MSGNASGKPSQKDAHAKMLGRNWFGTYVGSTGLCRLCYPSLVGR